MGRLGAQTLRKKVDQISSMIFDLVVMVQQIFVHETLSGVEEGIKKFFNLSNL